MIANYHSHTPLCQHACGAPEEYVQAALEAGLQIYGFSDHCPQWFKNGYHSTIRMTPEEFPGYCDTVRDLQARYKQLQIPLGLESEYYPLLFSSLVEHARDQGVEYMILGQHRLGADGLGVFSSQATADEELLSEYCTYLMDGMQTGLFTYVAHPDLINYVGDPKIYDRYMRRLCQEAVSTNTPLELNILGVREGRHYPGDTFWRIAGEEGCTAILGIDAHAPSQILDLSPQKKCLELAEKYNIPVLETIELRKV